MQWDASKYAGFTAPDAATEPWIGVNPNHVEINAAENSTIPDSAYTFYKKLIAMRHNNATIATGEWNLVAADSEQVQLLQSHQWRHTTFAMVVISTTGPRRCLRTWRTASDGVSDPQVLLSTYDAMHSVKSIARGELARWEGVVIQL